MNMASICELQARQRAAWEAWKVADARLSGLARGTDERIEWICIRNACAKEDDRLRALIRRRKQVAA